MALYHFSLRKISRSKGSVTNAISYISAQKLKDIYTGISYDYQSKKYVDDTVIILPDNAPKEWADLQTLTNAINESSNQPQATLAREIEFALPIELPSTERRQLALDFIKETFVDDGMVAIVSFHSPKKNEEDEESYNPHVHVILTAKPLDEKGVWISKTQKMYVCENLSGKTLLLTAEEIKQQNEFEKMYHFRDLNGNESWHSKSFVNLYCDGMELINRYPKSVQVSHPKIEKWADPQTLECWRATWAAKQNIAYKQAGIDMKVNHKSYERQGLELIPTVHEGKEITALERKLEEEF